ncbi:methylisocitrate lyase [Escherichia coli]|uniref:Methylisocitrate lyase n=1 Tax=Escherichia coli TaxID=562 RepID=A0A376ZP75_ECOLX|nr:methylisocitrate lyase [Escherichia coli]
MRCWRSVPDIRQFIFLAVGVAAGSLGLPDLGISTLDDVLTDIRRITDVCSLPLLVDADIGFGSSAFNVGAHREIDD